MCLDISAINCYNEVTVFKVSLFDNIQNQFMQSITYGDN